MNVILTTLNIKCNEVIGTVKAGFQDWVVATQTHTHTHTNIQHDPMTPGVHSGTDESVSCSTIDLSLLFLSLFSSLFDLLFLSLCLFVTLSLYHSTSALLWSLCPLFFPSLCVCVCVCVCVCACVRVCVCACA